VKWSWGDGMAIFCRNMQFFLQSDLQMLAELQERQKITFQYALSPITKYIIQMPRNASMLLLFMTKCCII
jgi:hypothetical protein